MIDKTGKKGIKVQKTRIMIMLAVTKLNEKLTTLVKGKNKKQSTQKH